MNAIDQFPARAGSSYGGFPCSLGQRSGVRFIVPAASNLENKGGRRRRRHYAKICEDPIDRNGMNRWI